MKKSFTSQDFIIIKRFKDKFKYRKCTSENKNMYISDVKTENKIGNLFKK